MINDNEALFIESRRAGWHEQWIGEWHMAQLALPWDDQADRVWLQMDETPSHGGWMKTRCPIRYTLTRGDELGRHTHATFIGIFVTAVTKFYTIQMFLPSVVVIPSYKLVMIWFR